MSARSSSALSATTASPGIPADTLSLRIEPVQRFILAANSEPLSLAKAGQRGRRVGLVWERRRVSRGATTAAGSEGLPLRGVFLAVPDDHLTASGVEDDFCR